MISKWILMAMCIDPRAGAELAVRFKVYPELVINTTELYPRQSVIERISESEVLRGRRVESASCGWLIKHDVDSHLQLNGFAEAIHLAYAQHHGLALSPDHIYIAILQGLAIHINVNPEKHKQILGLERLAPGQKESLDVRRDQFILGKFDNDWQGVFPEFQQKIATKVDRPLYKLLSISFSTSTPLSQTISALTIMDAFKAYFEYSVTTMCGIPEIALMGTPQDWVLLRQSTKDLLSKFKGLDYWLDELLPILDEFIHTTNNKRSVEFWSNIYKPDGGSGGPYIRGWINSLFPYIQTGAGFIQNPHVAWKEETDPFSGLQYNQIPIGFTDTPFTWNYFDQKLNVSFVGGFLGIEKGPLPNYVAPALAWSVLHSKH